MKLLPLLPGQVLATGLQHDLCANASALSRQVAEDNSTTLSIRLDFTAVTRPVTNEDRSMLQADTIVGESNDLFYPAFKVPKPDREEVKRDHNLNPFVYGPDGRPMYISEEKAVTLNVGRGMKHPVMYWPDDPDTHIDVPLPVLTIDSMSFLSSLPEDEQKKSVRDHIHDCGISQLYPPEANTRGENKRDVGFAIATQDEVIAAPHDGPIRLSSIAVTKQRRNVAMGAHSDEWMRSSLYNPENHKIKTPDETVMAAIKSHVISVEITEGMADWYLKELGRLGIKPKREEDDE